MKNCKTCGIEFIGFSPKALAQKEYCATCMAERRKRRQKEYIKRTGYNRTYAKKHYGWKNEGHLSDNKNRTCLSCEKPFESTGPGNRICPRCKQCRGDLDYELVPKKVFIRQGIGSRE